ncbi:hypothetical protein [Falsiroseomonas stagni]|uniref:Uncharacterized protein n=1 Tax=Falsiroseomonas stagni DSM 19981 TaxID=1123062 RepID=A0A1I4EF70_9PROT|nr:hypothetical protein [Falsiroseomonas stagni]SFL02831.1 hypothetical protein SAMN02745775_11516 [Falsiroseomonas stagni DSM 19981]
MPGSRGHETGRPPSSTGKALALTALITAAAGTAAFALTTPRPGFVTECLDRSSGYTREEALDRCEEELSEWRLDRTLATMAAVAGALVVIPAVTVTGMAVAAWRPWVRRRPR